MYLPPDNAEYPDLPVLCALLWQSNDGSADPLSEEEEAPLRAHLVAKIRGWTKGGSWRARYDNAVLEMALATAEYLNLACEPADTADEPGAPATVR